MKRPLSPACSFLGCLHLLPLPGSAGWKGSMDAVLDRALRETALYLEEGVDGLIIENTHDAPYLRQEYEPGTIAACARVATEVRRMTDLPVGLQVLAAADMAALEVAVACDLDFIRAEGFAYAHVADEGIVQGNAARLLRRRAHLLAAGQVEVWTDVKKKHSSHALTADLDVRAYAEGAVFCGADGLIVTGAMTGSAPRVADVEAVRGLGARVVVGSGVDLGNIATFAAAAEVLIVGSACKVGGAWPNEVERARVRALLDALRAAS